ncbi:hypothetical protein CVT91_14455, partial [Candidatus Atribacteria bacterium HGW-Atribacteria-1]
TATYKNLVLKDVVEPDGVKAGKTYDAGTANCESTALALVVEYLLDMGLDADEIETTLETYIETDKFADLVDTVCCIIEDCDNITNYCCLVECDIPEFTCETTSLNINIPTPACDVTCTTISKPITVKFVGKDDVVINDFSDTRLDWTIPSGISFTEISGEVCLTGAVGTYNIKVTYVDPLPDLCGSISKTIPVTFTNCSCPPPTSLNINIPTPACDATCTTISKPITVKFVGKDDVVINNFSDSRLDWTIPSGISFDKSNGKVCLTGAVGTYNITATYTDDCGIISKTIPVAFSECECGPCGEDGENDCFTVKSWTSYDSGNDKTTFWFKICDKSGSGCSGLSHWVYGTSTQAEFCIDIDANIGYDGSTGYYGIKWENNLPGAGECKIFTVVLEGCRVGGTYKAILKYGTTIAVFNVCGPTCD